MVAAGIQSMSVSLIFLSVYERSYLEHSVQNRMWGKMCDLLVERSLKTRHFLLAFKYLEHTVCGLKSSHASFND